MFKKLFTILLSIIFITGIFHARQITFSEAQIIAENWTEILEEEFSDQVRVMDGREIVRENILVAYVFDFYPKGYVIISGQDYLPPIKMYSLNNDFNTSAKPIEDQIFRNFCFLINKVKLGELRPEIYFDKSNKINFNKLLNKTIGFSKSYSPRTISSGEVEPLLSTKWDQGSPFNDLCPVIDGDKKPAGCVAIARAQILNYYEWPARGRGEHSYYLQDSDLRLQTNFDKEYQWWNMTTWGSGEPDEENAIAELVFDVGVASEMIYDYKWGAGAYSSLIKYLIYHFKYSTDSEVINRYEYKNDTEWFLIIKNQIDNGWPVSYSIGGYLYENIFDEPVLVGHQVVIDGYRISEEATTFHINFGWNGGSDGYYSLNSVKDYLEINYQNAMINFYPYPEYERPIGLPPENVSISAYLNQSVFLKEYIVQISWPESPSKDKRIDKYIIYQKEAGSVSEVSRVDPKDGRSYEFRTKNLSGISYSVGVIDKNGAISDMPSFVTPVLR